MLNLTLINLILLLSLIKNNLNLSLMSMNEYLNGEEIIGTVYEQEFQKTKQE